MTAKKWILVFLAATLGATGAFASGSKEDDTNTYQNDSGSQTAGSQAADSGQQPPQNQGNGPGQGQPPQGQPPQGQQQMDPDQMREEMLAQAETFEGTFTLVEDEYPALVDNDGKTWYLLFPGMMMGGPEGREADGPGSRQPGDMQKGGPGTQQPMQADGSQPGQSGDMQSGDMQPGGPEGDQARPEFVMPENGSAISVQAISGGISPVHLMVLSAEVNGEEFALPGPPMAGGPGGPDGGGRPGNPPQGGGSN